MGMNLTEKLLHAHVEGPLPEKGEEVALQIDQTLTQDGTGTMVMLELEAMGVTRARTEVSAQYVDHNLIQSDHRNSDDHLFLHSAAQKYGLYFSMPGNGVSHPVHMQRLAVPGKTLLGSDSHTCACGSMGMLAIGAGGIDVAQAIAGEPFYVKRPKVWRVHLTGALSDWVSAKDVILEMLRRHGVKGGVGWVLEYDGPGLESLSAMDRHVIANMGAELGATTSVFPSDEEIRDFLKRQDREHDWIELKADTDAVYDRETEMDLAKLVPLIAKPSSPDNVVPVADVVGEPVYQAYIGSSGNPGYRDFAVVAEMVKGRQIAPGISLDINPTSRQMLADLVEDGHIASLLAAGARLHQAGCNGCIGLGQAPASGRNSLRTTPRNFPGRSGTKEDSVFLCSPETAAAAALTGVITDPRTLDMSYPRVLDSQQPALHVKMLEAPLSEEEAKHLELVRSDNIVPIKELSPLPDEIQLPVMLKAGDNVSTDDIIAGGSKVMPFRSNLPASAAFAFEIIDPTYAERAKTDSFDAGHIVIGAWNYGQGSSREHAALAPRYLGMRVVIAKSFARIHHQNLVNFGILPLTFSDETDYDQIEQGDVITIRDLYAQLEAGNVLNADLKEKGVLHLRHDLSSRHLELLRAGGSINLVKQKQAERDAAYEQ
ncbi:aconitate hydratase [Salisediminibacterium beveridgei]|uniref:aconitate hydratase n=1 Tax=Salisediminibacterium beveridgei TaxID=632773 RepID=A0A1D7QS68_9BACI|nr:aconitate hydratase [Salisediminibacterium beveridgei]AOM81839.1 3-isopropylmalate dehydratase large subunit [Salisediminibacterium beveridgei]